MGCRAGYSSLPPTPINDYSGAPTPLVSVPEPSVSFLIFFNSFSRSITGVPLLIYSGAGSPFK